MNIRDSFGRGFPPSQHRSFILYYLLTVNIVARLSSAQRESIVFGSMSYDEALAALMGPEHQALTPEEIKKASLRRTRTVLDMQEYWRRIQGENVFPVRRVIHVAGTKGKGSTSIMCETICRHRYGMNTGLFTSPHLIDVRERIRINGLPVNRHVFAKAYWDIRKRLEQGSKISDYDNELPILPGYFRMLTLLGLYIFGRHVEPSVDVIILEVGMGGRYDATNILPMTEYNTVCGVTLLDFDHVRVLGNRIEQIAWEKAGIFQVVKGPEGESSSRPFSEGWDPEKRHDTPKKKSDRRFFALDTNTESAVNVLETCARIEGQGGELVLVGGKHPKYAIPADISLGLAGKHQRENAALAVALTSELYRICGGDRFQDQGENAMFEGLSQVFWPGRCQTVHFHNHVFRLDGAHTIQSVRAGIAWFQSVRDTNCSSILLFNCSHERNPVELLLLLKDAGFDRVIFCRSDTSKPSMLSKKGAKAYLEENGVLVKKENLPKPPETWEQTLGAIWKHINDTADVPMISDISVIDAVSRIGEISTEVFVTGSLYLVGSVLNAVDWSEEESGGRLDASSTFYLPDSKYWERLHLDPPEKEFVPSLENLKLMQERHLAHIPFENLAQHGCVGGPATLDVETTAEKILMDRRGGFCFELNSLFGCFLRQIGYKVIFVMAHVCTDDGYRGEPSHVFLLVSCLNHSQTRYFVDVGFGEPSLHPLEYNLFGVEQESPEGMKSKIVKKDDLVELFWLREGKWQPRLKWSYAQSFMNVELRQLQDALARVQEPDSFFSKSLLITRLTRTKKLTLAGDRFIVTGPPRFKSDGSQGSRHERVLSSSETIRNLLSDEFGVPLESTEGLELSRSEASESVTKIELVLLDLRSFDSMTPEDLTNLLDRTFDSVVCYEAAEYLQNKSPESSTALSMRKDIERFVRTSDRLLSLGSCLLKNRAFWKTLDSQSADNKHPIKPILVRLPRAMHNKPFLPSKNTTKKEDDGSLSVSHQFPFVGAAQRVTCGNDELKVGCDIVVQEPLNTRLYATWDDFLEVFRHSFADSEWEIVVEAKTAQTRLHEFLLRWAVKEAYTKALGVGLGFDFASFSVHFELPESCAKQLENFLASETKTEGESVSGTFLRGTVQDAGDSESTTFGTWDFIFVSLGRDPWSWACIAVGPVEDGQPSVDFVASWTTLEELVGVNP